MCISIVKKSLIQKYIWWWGINLNGSVLMVVLKVVENHGKMMIILTNSHCCGACRLTVISTRNGVTYRNMCRILFNDFEWKFGHAVCSPSRSQLLHTMRQGSTWCNPKVPEAWMPQLNHLPKFLFASIPFEVVPFCINAAIPAEFPWSEALLEVISRQRLHHVLRFGLDLFNAVKTSPLELQFHLWEKEKITGGEFRWVGRVGNDCRVRRSQKLPHDEYKCSVETKKHSSQWKVKSSPKTKRSVTSSLNVKTMLINFFDSQSLVHYKFVSRGSSVIQEFYSAILWCQWE
jgi:hypothetical protein